MKALSLPDDFPDIMVSRANLSEAALPDVEFLKPRLAALFDYFGIEEANPAAIELLLYEVLLLFPGFQPADMSRPRGARKKDRQEMIRFHQRIQKLYEQSGLSPTKYGDQVKLLAMFKNELERDFPRYKTLNWKGTSRLNFARKCQREFEDARSLELIKRHQRHQLLKLASKL
ncbi:hypothetical protein [Bosea sp. RAC05]|uniref:hypothetical protein n=1 Tax=Bosea sp. RAC05 TaxID=1842539 RepID=UPI0012375E07|nr:hypothetical protein [Bosea sp. RAC05]